MMFVNRFQHLRCHLTPKLIVATLTGTAADGYHHKTCRTYCPYLNISGTMQVDENADKLDCMMCLVFKYFEDRINAGDTALTWKALLRSFHLTVLNTYRSKFTQYLLWFFLMKVSHCLILSFLCQCMYLHPFVFSRQLSRKLQQRFHSFQVDPGKLISFRAKLDCVFERVLIDQKSYSRPSRSLQLGMTNKWDTKFCQNERP